MSTTAGKAGRAARKDERADEDVTSARMRSTCGGRRGTKVSANYPLIVNTLYDRNVT
jgi:hypothetical protein